MCTWSTVTKVKFWCRRSRTWSTDRPAGGPYADRTFAKNDSQVVPRQRLYRTPAVVLKRMDLGEADRVLTLFTRDEGKVRAVARGVRRTTSRSAGHLEPFALSDILFAVGRELNVTPRQVDTIESFRQVREDLVLTTHAYYLAEIVDLLTDKRFENRAVFEILVEAFRNLSLELRCPLGAHRVSPATPAGARLPPRTARVCRLPRHDRARFHNRFAALLGGVLCPACGPRRTFARPIGVPALKLVRYVQHTAGANR